MSKCGFSGHYNNHSRRATCATRLFANNVDEQLIQEVTGHRSHDGVRSYKRTSDEKKFETNKLLRTTANPEAPLKGGELEHKKIKHVDTKSQVPVAPGSGSNETEIITKTDGPKHLFLKSDNFSMEMTFH